MNADWMDSAVNDLVMEWRARESFHGQMAEGDLDRMARVAIEILNPVTFKILNTDVGPLVDIAEQFRREAKDERQAMLDSLGHNLKGPPPGHPG